VIQHFVLLIWVGFIWRDHSHCNAAHSTVLWSCCCRQYSCHVTFPVPTIAVLTRCLLSSAFPLLKISRTATRYIEALQSPGIKRRSSNMVDSAKNYT